MFEWGAKILDEAVAWYMNISYELWSSYSDSIFRYLSAHVMDGYRFLMDNHRMGDKICIFGRLFQGPLN